MLPVGGDIIEDNGGSFRQTGNIVGPLVDLLIQLNEVRYVIVDLYHIHLLDHVYTVTKAMRATHERNMCGGRKIPSSTKVARKNPPST
jgi:hypothetical protein